MCAAAIPIIGLVASVASTAVGAYSSIQQGKAAAQAANYQAAVDRNNADYAHRQAEDARDRGQQAEEAQRKKTQQLLGRQKAVMGANGIMISEGSALDVLGDTAALGELDAQTVRGNFEREALGHEAQSSNFNADAELQKMRAKSARNAGAIGAFGEILGGTAGVADKWYKTFGDSGGGSLGVASG